ncbi:Crp/Fnr family transcriptional regulator [Sphingomonas quercus]|uniref:Crp/Fnr family transcriptional regulator n=1 Tax=Sphingomonas quercus TaxID=2842451 RepID=A0ABS6BGU3_9SPHN|nr:Crp/Fnr family transcriptional regulator [Sphingomonas quercus]MBU3077525.1 Crp/Fnr family transcriptional regulator [Sphingomonas quercus]
MIERHIARLRARHSISGAEEQAIRGLVSETRRVAKQTVLIREGALLDSSTLLLDGLLCRYKDMEEGRRQITELHLPGDFADLHSFTLKRLDHNILAMSDSLLATVPHERIQRLINDHPRLGRIYWFSTNLDAAIHREWVLSLGTRGAAERTATLFCELQVRIGLIDGTSPKEFMLRMSQSELAECLGITPIHVNRTLARLREEKLMSFRHNRAEIYDLAGLRRLADFDDGYLYLDPEPL